MKLNAMAISAAIMSSLTSCSSTPSQGGFVRSLHNNVGRSIDTELLYCSKDHYVTDVNLLSNQHDEYKHVIPRHRGVGACTYFCEVDQKTRTVVAVRIDGMDNGCVQFP